MSELVTGEAVALELRPAKLPSRGLAVLIDLVVAWAVYLGVTIGIVASTSSLDDAAAAAVAVASFVLILVGGPIAVETLSHGRSLGKAACGLRVVRDDGGPIRFRHALVRGAVGVVEILLTFGVVACIASLVSARGRRLGDVFAGTLVVRERVPAAHSGFVPAPPPWLAGRFAELDLSGVPEGLWLAIRQYLTRMGQLDPQVGGAMAQRLAGDLAERTGAPAPQGVPPAAYLAAVVQERQVRDARRAFGGSGGGSGSAGSAGPGYAVPPGYVVPGAPGPGASAPVGYPGGGVPPGPASHSGRPTYPARPAGSGAGQESQEGAEAAPPGTGFVPPA
ncbi:RDD family protein [Streptomyces sp. NPDC055243]|uniref:RDD family protein n=1 Tax=Streptomyces sp. NPDC055243 TaxID=3365720 RepID=UPI0037D34A72